MRRVEAEGLAAQIGGKTVIIEAKAGDGGKLFGSVTAGMVADALGGQFGIEVDRKRRRRILSERAASSETRQSPRACAFPISARAASTAAWSAAVRYPCAWSMAACARDARTSWATSRSSSA